MQLKKMAGVVGLLMLGLLTGSALAKTNAAIKTIGYQTALAGEFRSLGAPTAG